MISEGLLTHLASGIDKLIGLASGLILGALITYYLLKDGTRLRRSVVARFDPRLRNEIDSFIGDACRILRRPHLGRALLRDRSQERRPASVGRLLRPDDRPRPTGPATHARLRWAN